MKFLLWALVIAVVIAWLVRGKKAPGGVVPDPDRKPDAGVNGEAMICCAYCGTHVPKSESIVAASGTVFCSDEHRRLHAGA
jgi:uncharacterized protein